MKTRIALLLMVAFCAVASLAFAQEKIPSLLGKWQTESIGGMLVHGQSPGPGTHWEPKQKVLKGGFDITTQDGRFVTGVYTSERGSEKFIGMIAADGKHAYMADTDGYWDCTIIDNDTIEQVYRHVKGTDTVVAIGISKRQK